MAEAKEIEPVGDLSLTPALTPTSTPTLAPTPTAAPTFTSTSTSTLRPTLPPIPTEIPTNGELAPIIWGAPDGVVVLTSDDSVGHVSRATQILDILASFGVKAVFFPNGDWANSHPELIQRMKSEGHVVGNHTATHPNLRRLSDGEIRKEILGGVRGDFFRPPYGAFNKTVRQVAKELGYTILMWNVDPRDWDNPPSPEVLAKRVVKGVVENHNRGYGSIVVLHLHGVVTPEALPMIIEELQGLGFKFGLP